MAVQPTAEDIASLALSVFVSEFDCRPGESLPTRSFYKVLGKRAGVEDCMPGIRYATDRGWLEIVNDNTIKLTTVGFSTGAKQVEVAAATAAAAPPPQPQPEPEPEPEPAPVFVAPPPPAPIAAPAEPAKPVGPPRGFLKLDHEEADFIVRFISGEMVPKNPPLQARLKAKILAADPVFATPFKK
jgi:hypothetical protein